MKNPQSESIKERLFGLRSRIKLAAEKSGRREEDISLVAVTKTVPEAVVAEAISAGIRDVGENRVQEAIQKFAGWSSPNVSVGDPSKIKPGFPIKTFGNDVLKSVRFHMIGHLQTNKARKAVELFDVIQSVDGPDLARSLDRIAGETGKIQCCFVEVKISPEAAKSGVLLAEAPEFIQGFSAYKNLALEGLMTIPPFGIPAAETREYFKRFKQFFDSMRDFLGERPVLSMGMSDDFEAALEEGSTMVRIGSALFGERAN